MTDTAAVLKYFEESDSLVKIELKLEPWGYTIRKPKVCPEWWMTPKVGVAMWWCRGWTYTGIGRAFDISPKMAKKWVQHGIKIVETEIGDNNNVQIIP